MTVASDVNKCRYMGNGVTRVWPYTFLLYDAAHLQVWVKRGEDDPVMLERGYVLNEQKKTVTYPPGGTGEAPLSADDQIIIMRVVPVLQSLNLQNQGGFHSEIIEKHLDLIVMMIQQVCEELSRAVKAPLPEGGGIGDEFFNKLKDFFSSYPPRDFLEMYKKAQILFDALQDKEQEAMRLYRSIFFDIVGPSAGYMDEAVQIVCASACGIAMEE